MSDLSRRNFLAGIIAAATAPAFIKTAGILMPIRPLIVIPVLDVAGFTEDGFWLTHWTELSLAA